MNGDVEMGSREHSCLEGKEKLLLKVRTKEGSELDFTLQKSDIVNDLKQAITERLQLADKNVRLIFSGKLLDPPNASLNSFKLDNGSFIHAVITNRSAHAQSQGEIDSERIPAASRIDLSNLRGLDTLMLPGAHRRALSIDEVASVRSSFHESIAEYTDNHMERARNETDVEYNYRCESEWMAAQGPNSEFRLNLYGRSLFGQHTTGDNSEGNGAGARALRFAFANDLNGIPSPETGTYREFVYGFMMGFALGFMMVFCLWDSNVSHKQKIGILTGMLVQMLLTFLQGSQGAAGAAGGQHSSSTTSSTTSSTSSAGAAGGGGGGVQDVPVIDGSGF